MASIATLNRKSRETLAKCPEMEIKMYRYNSEHGSIRPTTGERLSFSGMLVRLAETIAVGLERRRQRLALARLDDRMLRDIGLTSADVEGEVTKPFWK
jgi:uncharacterized protein YjiS (DUF1127 family)